MTQRGDGKVSFTFGSLVSVYGALALSLAGNAFMFHGRVVTLESQATAHEKRLDGLEQQDRAIENLIREEFRALRTELKN